MTEMLATYRDLKARGTHHETALRELARRLDVDVETARRIVRRAERAERTVPTTTNGDTA